MNRIEDEPIRFYLEHEARIREWAGLDAQVREVVNRFYRSIKSDLDTALRCGKVGEDDVESFFDDTEKNWSGLGLRRQGWPRGKSDPDVRLEWSPPKARFSPGGHLICGVRTDEKRYREPFEKEKCPGFPQKNGWWPAYVNVAPPVGKFWEGDNLKEYRADLVQTILTAWKDLAPLVDKAVGHLPS